MYRLPFGTIIFVDSVVDLKPQYDDCINVQRLHVTSICDISITNNQHATMKDYIGGQTVVNGWVSLTGRTVEDSAAIVAFVTFPS